MISLIVGACLLRKSVQELIVCAGRLNQAQSAIVDPLFELLDVPTRKKLGWRFYSNSQRSSIISPSGKQKFELLSGDPKASYGKRPTLQTIDEPREFIGISLDRMVAAAVSSLGKHSEGRVIVCGTLDQPDSPFDEYLRMADYSAVYQGSELTMREAARANPSLRYMPDKAEEVKSALSRARRNTGALALVRSNYLNQGTPDTDQEYVLTPEQLRAAEVPDAVREGAYVLGLDTSETQMMGFAAVWENGHCEVLAAFPSLPDLAQRGRRDNVGSLYCQLYESGQLMTAGRSVVDITLALKQVQRRWGDPAAVVSDKFRKAQLIDSMREVGWSSRVVWRRFGPHDGGQDFRDFTTALLDGYVRFKRSRLARVAFRDSRVGRDSNGNVFLIASGRRAARNDVVAAALVSIAVWWRHKQAQMRDIEGPLLDVAVARCDA